MIWWTTPVSRKRITYQTEHVGTTKIRRVIVQITSCHWKSDVKRVKLFEIWDSYASDCKGYLIVGVPQCGLVDRCQRFEYLLCLSSEQRILKTEMVISPETFVLSVGLQGMLLYTAAVFLLLTYHYSDSMNKNCVGMETIHVLLSAIFLTRTCITFEVNWNYVYLLT